MGVLNKSHHYNHPKKMFIPYIMQTLQYNFRLEELLILLISVCVILTISYSVYKNQKSKQVSSIKYTTVARCRGKQHQYCSFQFFSVVVLGLAFVGWVFISCFFFSLPVVLGGTFSSILGVFSSLIDGLHDGLVLGIEGDGLDYVVHLVPHLGGSEVVISRNR